MDMALEMGSSFANLGGGGNAAATSFRPDGSFCVVPPGSSYASSSSMWTSGIILGGGGGGGGGAGNAQLHPQHQQQSKQNSRANNSSAPQQSIAGVRSRANRLQNFLGGGGVNDSVNSMQQPQASTPSQQILKEEHGVSAHDNESLGQSWWGGGQGSLLASSTILSATAIATTTSSIRKSHTPANHLAPGETRTVQQNTNDGDTHDMPSARQKSTSSSSATNARQLMQLMDSLNRLGNENAQLMREVEGAKVSVA